MPPRLFPDEPEPRRQPTNERLSSYPAERPYYAG